MSDAERIQLFLVFENGLQNSSHFKSKDIFYADTCVHVKQLFALDWPKMTPGSQTLTY